MEQQLEAVESKVYLCRLLVLSGASKTQVETVLQRYIAKLNGPVKSNSPVNN